jgi:hypothetical protein
VGDGRSIFGWVMVGGMRILSACVASLNAPYGGGLV